MSTTPEVITARHLDLTVFGISLVVDMVPVGESFDAGQSHEEVLRVASQRAPDVGRLLEAMLKKL